MDLLRTGLAVALTIILVGCQSTGSPTASEAPEPPPLSSAYGLEVQGLSEAQADGVVAPQQMVGCSWKGAWYLGYDACMRYDTGFWWFIWPHGHGFAYCYYSIYLSSGRWSTWTTTSDWSICNQ